MLLDPDTIESLSNHGIRNARSPNDCVISTPSAKDLPQRFVTQGLVDLQINGFAGVDYNDPLATPDAIEASMRSMVKTGVTRCLPTVITADLEWQSRCFKTLENARAQSALTASMITGYHLEGPFLNPEPGYSGCHPAADMRAGELDYFERVQAAANGQIRLVTVAPERPGVMALIPQLVKRNVCVAIGHSSADHETVQRAVEAGASMSTHLGNGVAPMVKKSDNIVLSQLANDKLAASFIADGMHLKEHVLGIYLRAKTAKRTVLVTDGTAGSAAKPGRYTLGKIAIERQLEPTVTIPGTSSLAGSATTLDQCVRNVCSWYEVSMQDAVSWASSCARRVIGMSDTAIEGDPVEWVWWETINGEPHIKRVQLGQAYIAS